MAKQKKKRKPNQSSNNAFWWVVGIAAAGGIAYAAMGGGGGVITTLTPDERAKLKQILTAAFGQISSLPPQFAPNTEESINTLLEYGSAIGVTKKGGLIALYAWLCLWGMAYSDKIDMSALTPENMKQTIVQAAQAAIKASAMTPDAWLVRELTVFAPLIPNLTAQGKMSTQDAALWQQGIAQTLPLMQKTTL